jgi:Zn-dependent peptidase ImmA (M78 family)
MVQRVQEPHRAEDAVPTEEPRMPLLDRFAQAIGQALDQKGVTPGQLARLASVEPSKIDDALSARPAFTSRELRRVAEALELDPHALQRGSLEPLRSLAIFLKHSSAFQDFRHDIDGEILLWVLERGIALAALHPQGNDRRRSFTPVPIGNETPAQQGFRLACEVRNRLDRKGPIADARALLEQVFAIPVYVRKLATNTTAIAVCSHRKTAAAALVGARKAPALDSPGTRISLAHELCHILFDPFDAGIQVVIEDGVNSDFERRANVFAVELLCPKAELQKMFPSPPKGETAVRQAAEKIAAHFGVNRAPALRQLQHHLAVSRDTVEFLIDEPHHPNHPLATPEDSPELLLLARKGWEAGIYSTSQAKAFLGLLASSDLPWPEE